MKRLATQMVFRSVAFAVFMMTEPLWAVTFTTNAWISEGDVTYDGQSVIVNGCTLTLDGAHVFDAVVVTNGGMITHSAGSNGVVMVVSNAVVVAAASSISANERGHLALSGTSGNSGGSHGGRGGQYSGTSCATYGDPFLPVTLGSGSVGGLRGGGRIGVTAATLQLDGVIRANGGGPQYNVGSGSGGAVLLRVGVLSGAGSVEAKGGGRGDFASGGGGGRIAIYYDTLAGFDLARCDASGGPRNAEPDYAGGAGTIYLRHTAVPAGALLVDNRGGIHAESCPTPALIDTNIVSRLSVSGQSRLNLVLNAPNAGLIETAVSNATLSVASEMLATTTLTLQASAILTHPAGWSNGLVIVAQNVGIDTSSAMNGDGRGLLALSGTSGNSGGSHGGRGGQYSGTSCATYGDPFLPVTLGSGSVGGLRGGGRIDLTAAALQLDGVIRANGGGPQYNVGSGSGGSVLLRAGTLSGAGSVEAKGGGRGDFASGGGGGRIAIYYDTLAGFDLARCDASGGPRNAEPEYAGGAGTIYLRHTAAPAGTLLVDNRGGINPAARPSLVTVTNNVFDRLYVRGQAQLAMMLSNPLYLVETVVSGAFVSMTGDVWGPDVLVRDGSWTHAGIFGFSNAVYLAGSTWLTHATGWSNGLEVAARLIHVGSNATIDVTARGDLARTGTTGGSGGSYGGRGSAYSGSSCAPYGDVFYPAELGSGGAGGATRGGGRLRLVADEVQLHGTLRANGQDGIYGVGSGSGGAILMETVRLTGSGTIQANGGALSSFAGVGGGGRVAVYYIEMDVAASNVTANAGAGHPDAAAGRGTVVIHGPRERFVVSTNSPYAVGSAHHFVLRSGAPAPVGVRVQCLASAPGGVHAFAPPTTDRWDDIIVDGSDAYGYFVPPDCREDGVRMTWMGDELTLTNAGDKGQPGFVASTVGFTISNRSSIGWLRAFSHATITGAAYYADTRGPDTTLDWPGRVNCDWDAAALVLSNINPAYVIGYVDVPHAVGDTIEGSVACVAGGADNVLASEAVKVEYRLDSAAAWEALDEQLSTWGEFNGHVNAPMYPTNAYVRARVKDEWTARRGLPASREYYVTGIVPEAGLGGVLLGIAFTIYKLQFTICRGRRREK